MSKEQQSLGASAGAVVAIAFVAALVIWLGDGEASELVSKIDHAFQALAAKQQRIGK